MQTDRISDLCLDTVTTKKHLTYLKKLSLVLGVSLSPLRLFRVTRFISNHIFSNNKIFAAFEKIFWWCCP